MVSLVEPFAKEGKRKRALLKAMEKRENLTQERERKMIYSAARTSKII